MTEMRALPKNEDVQDQPDPETDRVVAPTNPPTERRGYGGALLAGGVLLLLTGWSCNGRLAPLPGPARGSRRPCNSTELLSLTSAWPPSAPLTAKLRSPCPRPRRRLRRRIFSRVPTAISKSATSTSAIGSGGSPAGGHYRAGARPSDYAGQGDAGPEPGDTAADPGEPRARPGH